ncbi:MAG: hypothetical protein QOI95_2908 [Acidimicrobiaceae bacterium]|jgi:nitroreductase
METWDAIRARRDVRRYVEAPIADDQLSRVLEAGRRAPSAANRQPWDFVVVTDRDKLRAMSRDWHGTRFAARCDDRSRCAQAAQRTRP